MLIYPKATTHVNSGIRIPGGATPDRSDARSRFLSSRSLILLNSFTRNFKLFVINNIADFQAAILSDLLILKDIPALGRTIPLTNSFTPCHIPALAVGVCELFGAFRFIASIGRLGMRQAGPVAVGQAGPSGSARPRFGDHPIQ